MTDKPSHRVIADGRDVSGDVSNVSIHFTHSGSAELHLKCFYELVKQLPDTGTLGFEIHINGQADQRITGTAARRPLRSDDGFIYTAEYPITSISTTPGATP
jgi:hypothetical protein